LSTKLKFEKNSTTKHLKGYLRCLEILGMQDNALIGLGTIYGIFC